MGNVRINIEAFGEKSLTRVFEASELEGKSVKNILEMMVRDRWEGKDLTVSNALMSEIEASGGYAVSQKVGGENLPISYEPVSLTNHIREYEDDVGEEYPIISLAVSGHHVVGNKNVSFNTLL